MTLVRLKIVLLWLFAILLTAAQPVGANESFKEVEETQEVKFYSHNEEQVRKKTNGQARKQLYSISDQAEAIHLAAIDLERPPRYILYGSLNFYE